MTVIHKTESTQLRNDARGVLSNDHSQWAYAQCLRDTWLSGQTDTLSLQYFAVWDNVSTSV